MLGYSQCRAGVVPKMKVRLHLSILLVKCWINEVRWKLQNWKAAFDFYDNSYELN